MEAFGSFEASPHRSRRLDRVARGEEPSAAKRQARSSAEPSRESTRLQPGWWKPRLVVRGSLRLIAKSADLSRLVHVAGGAGPGVTQAGKRSGSSGEGVVLRAGLSATVTQGDPDGPCCMLWRLDDGGGVGGDIRAGHPGEAGTDHGAHPEGSVARRRAVHRPRAGRLPLVG